MKSMSFAHPVFWVSVFLLPSIVLSEESSCPPTRRPLQLLGVDCATAFRSDFNRRLCFEVQNVDNILATCGEVCNTTIEPKAKGKYFDVIEKKIDCDAIFNSPYMDKPSEMERPLRNIPPELHSHFTYGGRVENDTFFNNNFKREEEHYNNWSQDYIDKLRLQYRKGELTGSYGRAHTYQFDSFLSNVGLKGDHVLIVGTEMPWLEVLALERGAIHVTTLEYAEIDSEHPDMTTITPEEFKEAWNKGTLPKFDTVISHSSIEHSGLGRYGDCLNPWADLITMARLWCVLEPGARVLLGVPAGERDEVAFNSNRIYGRIMFSHLFANFRHVFSPYDSDAANSSPCKHCYEPIHYLLRE